MIWLVTLACLVMAFICIFTGSFVELPWITAMVGCPWAAYAVSQTFYYKKATVENQVGGLKYEATLAEINKKAAETMEMETFLFGQTYEAATDVDDYQI